ncbi:MAG: exodeoxyribonuclease III [Betaproteobacteria bacterium]
MRLATWNVNSLKVRLPHVLTWLARHEPDVMCLQETKLEDGNFPLEDISRAGYQALYSGQKTYNGVAILSRHAWSEVVAAVPGFEDAQKRVLAATVRGIRVVCVYVPNGENVESEKYPYKLKWLDALTDWLKDEIGRFPQFAMLGDFNIAPEERDVHDPAVWQGQVHFSDPEREAFRRLLALGLNDAFRLFGQPEKSFTWWDYRLNAFRRKMGLRIDHVLLTGPLAQRCTSCWIDAEPRAADRPSDHVPVVAELSL